MRYTSHSCAPNTILRIVMEGGEMEGDPSTTVAIGSPPKKEEEEEEVSTRSCVERGSVAVELLAIHPIRKGEHHD